MSNEAIDALTVRNAALIHREKLLRSKVEAADRQVEDLTARIAKMQKEWAAEVDIAVTVMRAEVNKYKRRSRMVSDRAEDMHRRAQKAEGRLARMRET